MIVAKGPLVANGQEPANSPSEFLEGHQGLTFWQEAGESISELWRAGQQKWYGLCAAAMMSVTSICPGLTAFLTPSLVSGKTGLGSEKIFPFEM